MPQLRLVLAFHHHQPLGQLESVLEDAYLQNYRPFLDGLETCSELAVALYTSGPLLEWLLERHPEYVDRLRCLVARGQVEVLGGGSFEPVMTMIPHRDRVGQIRAFTDKIHELFGTQVRGMWLPDGLWERSLVTSLLEAGIEYTVLDDLNFERGASQAELPFGYYLTEAEGRLLKVFRAWPTLGEDMLFALPNVAHAFLRRTAQRWPGSTIVFAGDGNTLGCRPPNFKHIDLHVRIEQIGEMIAAGRDWVEVATFAALADGSLPLGKVYLSDRASRWRNLQASHPESDEMYARMLGISQRLAAAESNAESDPDYLEVARDELYRGQCGSAYGHGGSGGLGVPQLRNAVYRHLIAAENSLDEIEGKSGPRVHAEVGDFNLDARLEVRLENDHLIALVRPALGGHVYELDVREQLTNVLASLDRRPEADAGTPVPQQGLLELQAFDRHPRKALVDHFYPVEASLEDLVRCRDIECGDFAVGTFQAKVQREPSRVALIMERAGRAGHFSIRVRKTIALEAGEPMLTIRYEIEQIPRDACLHFAVEINLAGMGSDVQAGAYYSSPNGTNLGTRDRTLDLPHTSGLSVSDQSLDLSVTLAWSQAAGLWCFPIETQSENSGDRERIHQSSAVIPHWHVTPDERGRWEVSIGWGFEQAASPTVLDRRRELIATPSPGSRR